MIEEQQLELHMHFIIMKKILKTKEEVIEKILNQEK